VFVTICNALKDRPCVHAALLLLLLLSQSTSARQISAACTLADAKLVAEADD
jgi:hypothetical protein